MLWGVSWLYYPGVNANLVSAGSLDVGGAWLLSPIELKSAFVLSVLVEEKTQREPSVLVRMAREESGSAHGG